MSKEFEVRLLGESEYDAWDRLVESSPAGTVYSTSWWVETMARLTGAHMEIVGCFSGDELCGGCAAYVRQWGRLRRVAAPPTTPYNGFVLREPATPSYRRRLLHLLDVSRAIAEFMEMRYDEVRLRHHYAFTDLRGMTWRDWDSEVYYTYLVDVSKPADILPRCSSSIRRTVKQAREAGLTVEVSDDIDAFAPLYQLTYAKHGVEAPLTPDMLDALCRVARSHSAETLLFTRDRTDRLLSGLIQLIMNGRACTWLLATDPDALGSGAAIHAQMHSFLNPPAGVTLIDEASANLPSLHDSEVKLGGELAPVYESYYSRSLLLAAHRGFRAVDGTRRFKRGRGRRA